MVKQLTYENRCHIYAYIQSGKSHREIARLIGCSHTTINKEVKRNSGAAKNILQIISGAPSKYQDVSRKMGLSLSALRASIA